MNVLIKIAGLLALFTAVLHLIGGQLSLVDPLFESDLEDQIITEWLGAWHMITVILFLFAYYLLRFSRSAEIKHVHAIQNIGWTNILFATAFIGASMYKGVFAPQFILFMLIGGLILVGQKQGDTETYL